MTVRKYVNIIPILKENKYFGKSIEREVLKAFLRGIRLTSKKYEISVNVAKKTTWYFENMQKRL